MTISSRSTSSSAAIADTGSTSSIANSEATYRNAPQLAWWPAFFVAGVIAALLVGLGFVLHGRPLAEKVCIALVMPIGALWLVVSGRVLQLLFAGRLATSKSIAVLWLMLSVCGTRPLPEALNRWLERSVTAYDPQQQAPLDVVIVLGGGTGGRTWRAQVGDAGDRIVMAAQLYHLGLAKRLVATGEPTPGVSSPDDSGQDTVEIWTSLGVPADAISRLPGRNTSDEIANIQEAWYKFDGQRVGLLTSANHLPRAMRLAAARGLAVVPIAAAVRTTTKPWQLLDFIPSAGRLDELASSQHEIMAHVVGR